MKRVLHLPFDPTIVDQNKLRYLVAKARDAAEKGFPEFMNILQHHFPDFIIHRTNDGILL